MDPVSALIGGLIAAAVVLGISFMLTGGARNRAREIIASADKDAQQRIKDADVTIKQQGLERAAEIERDLSKGRDQLHQRERDLDRRENQLDQRNDDLQKQQQIVEVSQNRVKVKLDQVNQTHQDITEVLEKKKRLLHEVTGLSKEDATSRLLKLLEDELSSEVGGRILAHEKRVQETCEQKSRDILTMAMQRFAASHTSDLTTSTVDIPNDDMKGRIIGREGRNIRAFEKAAGVDVIIDDTPGVVIVSGFDPVRREIARRSLNNLIADGRIHPSRIEEIVGISEKEIGKVIHEKGIEAAQEVDISGLKNPTMEMLGRLHFRTSYSQNVLRHSIEVSFLSGMLAESMGYDGDLARRCGLLHDIGKAADHDREGGHPKIGSEFLKKQGECPEVVHAALGHHDQILVEHPYTVIVATADACSASRPGARRESLDRYIKRMEELETMAIQFKGVQQAFAVQAGREVRVIVGSSDADDAKAAKICRDIANAYQEQLNYPGEIKVVVIRESRFTEMAK